MVVNSDTVELLKECSTGAEMGGTAIDEVIEHVRDKNLRKALEGSRKEHSRMEKEIQKILKRYDEEGKTQGAFEKGMARMKTSMRLRMDDGDDTVAGLITDGCNMGLKILSHSFNKCSDADEESKDIAKKMIRLEEKVRSDISRFL